MIETANQMHDNAEHYTDQGHVVERLITEIIQLTNQVRQTNQFSAQTIIIFRLKGLR